MMNWFDWIPAFAGMTGGDFAEMTDGSFAGGTEGNFAGMSRIKIPLGGHKRYWIAEYQFLDIPLPEQKRIAHTLNTARREITLLKKLADQYHTQKRGLMQKMLTGEWRVKPEIVNQYMEA